MFCSVVQCDLLTHVSGVRGIGRGDVALSEQLGVRYTHTAHMMHASQ